MIPESMRGQLQFVWKERRVLVPLYALGVTAALGSWSDVLRPAVRIVLISSFIAIAFTAAYLSFRLTTKTIVVLLSVAALSFLAVAGGVHIGFPFGAMVFTTALGPKALDVPVVVPFLWLALLVPAWSVSERVLEFRHVVVASIVVTAFDAVLELAAGSLDLWYWSEGSPSEFNYISWFLVSAILFSLLESYGEQKEPHWIVPHLLSVQLLFFVLADAGIRFLV